MNVVSARTTIPNLAGVNTMMKQNRFGTCGRNLGAATSTMVLQVRSSILGCASDFPPERGLVTAANFVVGRAGFTRVLAANAPWAERAGLLLSLQLAARAVCADVYHSLSNAVGRSVALGLVGTGVGFNRKPLPCAANLYCLLLRSDQRAGPLVKLGKSLSDAEVTLQTIAQQQRRRQYR
jgi:hypothetical protein